LATGGAVGANLDEVLRFQHSAGGFESKAERQAIFMGAVVSAARDY
jgi:hypothetical protein